MTTPEPRPGDTPGVRSEVPGVRVTGTGPATPAPAPAPAPTSTTPPAAPPAPARQRPKRTGRRIGLGLAAALLVFVTVVLVLFAVFNTDPVDISLVFTDVRAPLVLALTIAAVLGGLVVALAGLALRARHRDR